jgi:hypothetical protein
MRIRPRSPYERLTSPRRQPPTRYVTFLYENNETEFSKKLHVVPRGYVEPLAFRVIHQDLSSLMSFMS